jgi:hypothetical protein
MLGDDQEYSGKKKKTQYRRKIERLNSNSQKSTQNIEELGFSGLPQIDR